LFIWILTAADTTTEFCVVYWQWRNYCAD